MIAAMWKQLRRLGNVMAGYWRLVVELALIVIILLGMRGQKSRVVIEPFTKSVSLTEKAEIADGMNREFAYQLSHLIENADTHLTGPNVGPAPEMPDIEVPGTGLHLKALLDYFGELFGATPFTVAGHLVPDAAGCALMITVHGSVLSAPVLRKVSCDPAHIDAGLTVAAREALQIIAPVTLAGYCRAHKTECEPVTALHYAVHHPPASDDVFAYNLWGTLLYDQDPQAADVMLRESLAIDSGFGLAHFNRGYVLLKLGRREEGIREYETAV